MSCGSTESDERPGPRVIRVLPADLAWLIVRRGVVNLRVRGPVIWDVLDGTWLKRRGRRNAIAIGQPSLVRSPGTLSDTADGQVAA